MNNTIQDETFGEITFDGLNWIRTEPVTMTIAGKTFELRTEIESPDLVYDWARLGKLKQETIDKIFNPELGGIHHVLSKLEKTREHFSRAFLEGREMTQKSLEEVALRKLSEMAENEDRLSEIQLVLALVFNDRIEIKFNCNWYEQGTGYFVIPVNGDISMKPADMNMERLKKGLVNLGFVIKECRYQWFYVYSAEIPSKEQVRGMLELFTGYENMFFWNYYHKGGVEPGSYIDVEVVDGKPYICEGTHGCGGSNKNVDMDVLVEFIIRNWDKDSDWGAYDHQVAIRPTKPEYILDELQRRKFGTFYPDYSATPT